MIKYHCKLHSLRILTQGVDKPNVQLRNSRNQVPIRLSWKNKVQKDYKIQVNIRALISNFTINISVSLRG